MIFIFFFFFFLFLFFIIFFVLPIQPSVFVIAFARVARTLSFNSNYICSIYSSIKLTHSRTPPLSLSLSFRSYPIADLVAFNATLVNGFFALFHQNPIGGAAVFLGHILVEANRYSDLASLLHRWDFIHAFCAVNAEALLFELFDKTMTALASDSETVQDLTARQNFCEENRRVLHSETSWRDAAAKFSSLSNDPRFVRVIRGNLKPEDKLPSRLVRIFTSSTFDDLKVERDTLMAQAYPSLRSLCATLNLQFQAVDMRWGIR